jgi:lysozyme
MDLREQLTRDEGGMQLRPYRCTSGKLSIGIGRNLDDYGITRQEGLILFENDVLRNTAAVTSRLSWAARLDEPRFGVLVNLAFNMGIGSKVARTGLLGFPKMLGALEIGDWHTAARELLDSKYAGQVGDRATRLAQQVITGTWT